MSPGSSKKVSTEVSDYDGPDPDEKACYAAVKSSRKKIAVKHYIRARYNPVSKFVGFGGESFARSSLPLSVTSRKARRGKVPLLVVPVKHFLLPIVLPLELVAESALASRPKSAAPASQPKNEIRNRLPSPNPLSVGFPHPNHKAQPRCSFQSFAVEMWITRDKVFTNPYRISAFIEEKPVCRYHSDCDS